jgi:integrase
MGCGEITTHGFRSSFRDWAGEITDFPREIVEAALAHAVGDATERAYRRGDALDKRRQLMEAWANYLSNSDKGDHAKAGDVLSHLPPNQTTIPRNSI